MKAVNVGKSAARRKTISCCLLHIVALSSCQGDVDKQLSYKDAVAPARYD